MSDHQRVQDELTMRALSGRLEVEDVAIRVHAIKEAERRGLPVPPGIATVEHRPINYPWFGATKTAAPKEEPMPDESQTWRASQGARFEVTHRCPDGIVPTPAEFGWERDEDGQELPRRWLACARCEFAVDLVIRSPR